MKKKISAFITFALIVLFSFAQKSKFKSIDINAAKETKALQSQKLHLAYVLIYSQRR